jgi:hypothetical protein
MAARACDAKGRKLRPASVRRDATAEAIEKRHTELFFERLDLRSYVGLHGVHFFSGAGEVQLFSEGAKDL